MGIFGELSGERQQRQRVEALESLLALGDRFGLEEQQDRKALELDTLDLAEQLTGSRIALLLTVGRDGELQCPVRRSRRTQAGREQAAALVPGNVQGPWRDVLAQPSAWILNNYPDNLPVPGGAFPPGALQRLLLVPVPPFGERAATPVMLLAVANKPADYGDSDREILERVAQKLGRLLRRSALEQALRDSHDQLATVRDRLALVIRGSRDAIWDLDLVRRRHFFSERWFEMLGVPVPEELEFDHILLRDHFFSDDRSYGEECLANAIHHQNTFDFAIRLQHADGHAVPVQLRGITLRDEAGRAQRLAGVARDLSLRDATVERLRKTSAVFDNTTEAVMITRMDGTIEDVNNAFCRITGYAREEVLGKTPAILRSGQHNKAFYEDFWNSLRESGHWQGEYINRRRDGSVFPSQMSIVSVYDRRGRPTSYIAIFNDTTLLKQQQEELIRRAYYDPLTGLSNRVLASQELEILMRQSTRRVTCVAAAFIDLDRFKEINDRYGHATGDEVLRTVARRMNEVMREGDSLSRLGGDEFLAILSDLEDYRQAGPIVQRILDETLRTISLGDHTVTLGASIGISYYPQGMQLELDPDQLLRQADHAMYVAKTRGGGCYHFFDPGLSRAERSRHDLVEDIRRGLASGEFELYYQPKVDLARARVFGAEALLRWNHPVHGLRAPGAFLPELGDNPILVDIDRFVLKRALEDYVFFAERGHTLYLSLNVAAPHLRDHRFTEDLREALAGAPDVPPEHIELEILETIALENLDEVSATLLDCRSFGPTFAMDDFGSGYSSLVNLRKLPLHTVKLDQSLVLDLPSNEQDQRILRHVIALAKDLNLAVIAEGVETERHCQLLAGMGCDLIQGYVLSRPVPKARLCSWIDDWHIGRLLPPEKVRASPAPSHKS